jgi:hypothetical protein
MHIETSSRYREPSVFFVLTSIGNIMISISKSNIVFHRRMTPSHLRRRLSAAVPQPRNQTPPPLPAVTNRSPEHSSPHYDVLTRRSLGSLEYGAVATSIVAAALHPQRRPGMHPGRKSQDRSREQQTGIGALSQDALETDRVL